MKKLVVFLGESGSGKTTLMSKSTEGYPLIFKKVVTCTSRPKRPGEIDGIDYHFCPVSYFIDNNELVLAKKTDDGLYYGTRLTDLMPETHNLLLASKPRGIPKIIDLCGQRVAVVRLSISESLKIQRMRARGDPEEAISKRLVTDADIRLPIDSSIPTLDLDASNTVSNNVDLVLSFVHD